MESQYAISIPFAGWFIPPIYGEYLGWFIDVYWAHQIHHIQLTNVLRIGCAKQAAEAMRAGIPGLQYSHSVAVRRSFLLSSTAFHEPPNVDPDSDRNYAEGEAEQ